MQAIISMLAGGAQVAVFTAGRGTPVGRTNSSGY
ncbi:MAG: hypothetical protein ACOX3A_03200 [bacterium]